MCDKLTWGAGGVGKTLTAKMEFIGKNVAAADLDNTALTTLAVQTGLDAGQPYTFSNFAQTFGGGTVQISSFEIDAGNKVEPEIDPGDATSGQVKYHAIVSRDPHCKINPLKKTVAAYDAYATAAANTPGTLVLANTTATIPLQITVANGQLMNPKSADREGLAAWDLDLKCLRNGIDGTPVVSGMAVEAAWEILFGAKS
jgi:hypothetical protein